MTGRASGYNTGMAEADIFPIRGAVVTDATFRRRWCVSAGQSVALAARGTGLVVIHYYIL